jgi:hypothetical protein
MGAEAEPETIPRIAREHMEMKVKNLLPRRLAVSEKEVDALTPDSTRTERGGHALRNLHHQPDGGRIELREVASVARRNHEHVSSVHRPDVHERRAVLVSIDEAAWQLASENPADKAVLGQDSSSLAV